ncbi:hypothetical protein A2996_02855 [Candidatus Campbellbacteria bacterium RIFCSPLOWO2_01_FULL_34_15]|uniref:Uncharacterized protein n=2 Tax=Candidatus Campbelliibacteriota TaxID=1752727 RepID=A0A1F5EMQ7_9BACT|nr:MAG: hypothetical protein A2996_02855 [Candidatus Campbellbacteria bacterium RIFCSPLOWO2_01_FULL_34_15]OGD69066.1 MAG: hypothetical protein A2811_02125 [Candidatus Campbellbacteria bacterium RIFCSPHIGHO2_01_FULL_34_10]
MPDFVLIDFNDGSKVIGKHFSVGEKLENRVSVFHDVMNGTFIHVSPALSVTAHRLIQAILNSNSFDEKSTSALFNILNSIEADCAAQTNKQ